MPVVAKQTLRIAGHADMVVQDRAYADDDPVVKAYPWLFESTDAAATRQAPARSTDDLGERSMLTRKRSAEDPVEQATAAPGEKRTTRRQ